MVPHPPAVDRPAVYDPLGVVLEASFAWARPAAPPAITLALTQEQATYLRGVLDREISHHTRMCHDLAATFERRREANHHQAQEMLARGLQAAVEAGMRAGARP